MKIWFKNEILAKNKHFGPKIKPNFLKFLTVKLEKTFGQKDYESEFVIENKNFVKCVIVNETVYF